MATEDVVFGYRPPSSRKFMNSSDEPADDEDLLTDSEPTKTITTTLGELRKMIVSLVTR